MSANTQKIWFWRFCPPQAKAAQQIGKQLSSLSPCPRRLEIKQPQVATVDKRIRKDSF
jgi:hypothetical protein